MIKSEIVTTKDTVRQSMILRPPPRFTDSSGKGTSIDESCVQPDLFQGSIHLLSEVSGFKIHSQGKKKTGFGISRTEIQHESPWMIRFCLIVWLIMILRFLPSYLYLIHETAGWVQPMILAAYVGMQIIFWLLASYYSSVLVFSLFARITGQPSDSRCRGSTTPIAVLYPTYNDFQREAAETALVQKYPCYHLFIIDDSTDEAKMAAIDSFADDNADRVTIVRRGSRHGFKPGALNHVLNNDAKDYLIFAVIDADEHLPKDFLERAMGILNRTEYAFVQFNHLSNPHQRSQFARDLGPTIIPFWDVHCHARNRYGCVPYVGHGVVVRRTAWDAAGGFFPNVLTEDLEFTVVSELAGHRGYFLSESHCLEDFPANYASFRRQQERFITGTTQVLLRKARPIVASKVIPTYKKIDLFLWCLPLYVPALLLFYIILCNFALMPAFGTLRVPTLVVLGHQLPLFPIFTFDGRFGQLWSWDYQLVSILVSFSPIFATIVIGYQRRVRISRLIPLSLIPYLSIMLVSWKAILNAVFGLSREWIPTGCTPEEACQTEPRGREGRRLQIPSPGRLAMPAELTLGLVLAAGSILSLNLAFFAVACSLLFGQYVLRWGWEGRMVRYGSYVLFGLILLQTVLNLMLFSLNPASFPLIFSVHF